MHLGSHSQAVRGSSEACVRQPLAGHHQGPVPASSHRIGEGVQQLADPRLVGQTPQVQEDPATDSTSRGQAAGEARAIAREIDARRQVDHVFLREAVVQRLRPSDGIQSDHAVCAAPDRGSPEQLSGPAQGALEPVTVIREPLFHEDQRNAEPRCPTRRDPGCGGETVVGHDDVRRETQESVLGLQSHPVFRCASRTGNGSRSGAEATHGVTQPEEFAGQGGCVVVSLGSHPQGFDDDGDT